MIPKIPLASWRFYLEKKHRGIILFFDNVDRASEYYQSQVYKLAIIASQTGITIIITMREMTFFRGREGGFLDVRSE